MKLAFDRLVIHGFKHIVDLDIDLAAYGSGLHFFQGINKTSNRLGSNGSGKTTIWSTICWCLYGRTQNGLRNTDVSPWTGIGETMVSVHCRVDDEPHVIERGIAPNITKLDGAIVGQQDLNRLLGINFDLFINTVLIGQRQALFLDMTPADKMALFVAALDLDRWDRRSKLAVERTAGWDKHIVQLDADIAATADVLALWDDQIVVLREHSTQYTAERQHTLQNSVADRDKIRADLEKWEKEFAENDLIYDGAETELRAIDKELDELSDYLRISNDQLVEVRLAMQERDRLIAELKTCESGKCPTCGQSVRSLPKHKADLEKKIEATVDDTLIKGQINDLARQRDIAANARAEFRTKSRLAQDKCDYLRPIIAVAQASIKTLTENIEKTATDPYHEQITALRQQITDKKREQAKLTEDMATARETAERHRFWIGAFKDVKLFILSDVLSELEWTSAALLEDVGLSGWQISYAVEKETRKGTMQRGLTTTILSPFNDKPVRFECWSGGEGQRLRLVGALALADTLLAHAGVNSDIEILDEPTTSLSVEGIQDVCEWLSDRANRTGRQTFYVDHRLSPSAYFNTVTTVVRDNKGVHLE